MSDQRSSYTWPPEKGTVPYADSDGEHVYLSVPKDAWLPKGWNPDVLVAQLTTEQAQNLADQLVDGVSTVEAARGYAEQGDTDADPADAMAEPLLEAPAPGVLAWLTNQVTERWRGADQ